MRTKQSYEQCMNEVYGNDYSYLVYLTSKSRKNRISLNLLQKYAAKHQLGTVLRKYDTVAFHAGYSDYKDLK